MTQNSWRIIKNNDEHAIAMGRLIELASGDLQPGTDEFDEFELLGLLIEHYENSAYPMDKPDPIDAIKFRMDQQGLSQADMRQFIGSASKVSEVLNRKRPLSLSMIRRLHDGLGIPADILIQNMDDIEWSEIDTNDKQLVEFNDIAAYQTDLMGSFFSVFARESLAEKVVGIGRRPKNRANSSFIGVLSSASLVTDWFDTSKSANTNNDEFSYLI